MIIACAYCGKEADKPVSAVNRARQAGLRLFCNKACAVLARRAPFKTLQQKKDEKAAYDRIYREKKADLLKAKKAAAYQRKREDPEFLQKEREYRKKNMHRHVEYCRRPEYKIYKATHDREYGAKKKYGEFWECAILIRDLRRECLERMTAYDIRQSNGLMNKAQRRKRERHE